MKNLTITIAFITFCAVHGSPAAGQVTALWHWAFDNPANPGEANIGAHDATTENGTPVVNTADKVFGAGALDLDRMSNLLDGADSLPIGSRGYSVAVWIQPRCEECDLAGILSKHNISDDRVFGLEQGDRDASIRFSSYLDNENPTFIQTRSDTTEQPFWYHLAGVWDAQNQTQLLYVDGVLLESQIVGSGHSVGDSSLRIGLSDPVANGGVFFDGLIDEAWVFDGALSQAEVISLMNHNMVPEPTSGLLAVGAVVSAVGIFGRRRRRC